MSGSVPKDSRSDTRTNAQSVDEHYLEIMSALGHELRRPLTVIRGAATLMLDMAGRLPADKAVELLSLIDGNVEDMSDLIEDLLLMVHIEAGNLRLFDEPVDVAALVAAAVDAERRRTGDHPVTVLGATPGRTVDADRDRAVRALRALLDNAGRLGEPGSTIEVTVADDGDHVKFEVRDRGPGIPPAERQRVFEPFAKLQSGEGGHGGGAAGLGLGLFLVRGLARAMGGDADARERAGGGAAVWFTLRRSG